MAISDATKSLLTAGIWALTGGVNRATPEELGIDRAEGWPLAYEQVDTGRRPEREAFNQEGFEHDSAIHDIYGHGILPWDPEVDYAHDEAAYAFVTTDTGLHVSVAASGPTLGNATDPDLPGQLLWKRY